MSVPLSFFREATLIALQSILAHKMRTFLTLLGIIIGVASVMVVGAGIEGLESYVMESVSQTLGSNSFILDQYAHLGNVSEEEWEKMRRRNKPLRLEDLEVVRQRCSDCLEVAAELSTRQRVSYEGEEIFGVQVFGVTSNFIYMANQEVVEGRYLTPQEERSSQAVCVIGWDLREKFFPGQDPLGRFVKLRNRPLQVVGVLEKSGTFFGNSLDTTLYLPITSYQKIFGSRRSLRIRGTARDRASFETALDQARLALRLRHRLKPNEEDDFGLVSTDQINATVDQFTGAVAMVVVPITLISLLVGGIVVMNIMLVSVTERTFEIGLRKSIGARRRDILNQFLIESFILAALGGLLGVALAYGLTSLIEATTSLRMTIRWSYILLSIGVSGGIGILFGIYPAYQAARLDPIVALREER